MYRTIEWTPQGVAIRKTWTNDEEVAKYMNLDVHEFRWAMEEYGRCDTEITAWEPYEPSEMWPHDPLAEGEPDEYHPADTREKIQKGAEFVRRIKE
jgi:hypothetical protein